MNRNQQTKPAKSPRHCSSEQQGFTLIEIVIAIGIMAILITVGYAALSALGRSQSELKEQRDLQTSAFSVMNRLTREIRQATKTTKSADPEHQTFLRSENESQAGYPSDKLVFMASGAGQQLNDGFFNPGIIQISYELIKDPEDPSNPWLSLIREETPNKQPYEQALSERVTFPIHNRVAGLDFQFFDKSKDAWTDSWEDPNNIPDLVQLTVYLASLSNQVHTYTTTVKLSQ